MENSFSSRIKKGDSFCAIEVKATTRIRKQDLMGLQAISGLPGLRRKILVYRGKERQLLDQQIEVLPISVFCEVLAKGLGL